MIAKHIPRKKTIKFSFITLASYILDLDRQGEKVSYKAFHNCLSDTLDLALKEIEATQALNQRATRA